MTALHGCDRAAIAPDPELEQFIITQGLAPAGAAVRWTALPGGVSSDIWRVDLADRSLCVKRALATLRVGENWHAPVSRNAYEWAWISFAARHLPHAVPAPVAHDPQRGILAMSFLDPQRYRLWKQLLLEGNIDLGTARAVGQTLARLHALSAGDAAVERAFPTLEIFQRIRLEPYLRVTAQRHPLLASRLHALAERTAAARIALVHGDVSPKNILIGPDGPVFLDAECAWYGDPAFDVAFCANHFLLKCLARPASVGDYLACFAEFSREYLAGVAWEPMAVLEQRAAALLPGLFLARVDGQSPVEYVTDPRDKALVRETATGLLLQAPQRLAEVAEAWHNALRKAGHDPAEGRSR
jgi:tRNA A-37 threonylcarbamoyl transferase component Bud32